MPKCLHNRQKSFCKECGGSSICPHNRIKYNCKECGGSNICPHNRIKYNCKECGGSNICPHNRRKAECKECGYIRKLCPHNRQKSQCKECKGGSICPHNRRKAECKECGGKSICPHNRRKAECKECGGKSICPHNRRKAECKECGGSQICEHGKFKSTCKECGGASKLCPHNRQKSQCKECGGSQICEHGKFKSTCKECGGASICEHGKFKSTCKECGGSALCKSSWCNTRGISKYNSYCLNCCINICPDIQVSRNYKTKENEVLDKIKEKFPDFTWIHDKKVEDGCSKRRPDLLLDMGDRIIIVEVDENKHTNYDCSCENKRLMEISKDLQHRPIIFIRFNPDSYIDKYGVKISSCWKVNGLGVLQIHKQTEWDERIEILNLQIQYWIDNKTNKTIEIVELFYDN